MADTFFPGQALAMTVQTADRLFKLDSGDAALLYLYLLRHGGTAGLKWPDARLREALEGLRSLGLAPGEAPPPQSLPLPSRRPNTPPRTSPRLWRMRAPPSPLWRAR